MILKEGCKDKQLKFKEKHTYDELLFQILISEPSIGHSPCILQ